MKNLFRTLPAALLCATSLGLAALPVAAAPVTYVGGASGFAGGGTLNFSLTGDFTQLGLSPAAQNAGFATTLGGIDGPRLTALSFTFTGNSLIQAFTIDRAEASNSFFGFGVVDSLAFANGTGTPTLSNDPDVLISTVDTETGVQVTFIIANDPVFDNFLTSRGFSVRGVEFLAPTGGNAFLSDGTNNVFIDPVRDGGGGGNNNVPEPQSLALAMAGLLACGAVRRRAA